MFNCENFVYMELGRVFELGPKVYNDYWKLIDTSKDVIFTTLKNVVHENHIALQLELKNHSNTIVLQLHSPKCNSYTTTLYEYDDILNKFSC
jgi:hypothetical protein